MAVMRERLAAQGMAHERRRARERARERVPEAPRKGETLKQVRCPGEALPTNIITATTPPPGAVWEAATRPNRASLASRGTRLRAATLLRRGLRLVDVGGGGAGLTVNRLWIWLSTFLEASR